MPNAKYLILVVTMASLTGCASMWNPFRKPEPEEKIVEVVRNYCPPIQALPRPNPISIPTPEFLVIVPDDPRLEEAGAMVCLTASQYAALAEVMENSIVYVKDSQEVMSAYEALIQAQKDALAESAERE